MAKDFSFVFTNKPINSSAAKVMQKGFHFNLEFIKASNYSEIPLETIPIPTAMLKERNFMDLSGTSYGRFIVIGLSSISLKLWVVKCSCGAYETRTAKAIKKQLNANECCSKCQAEIKLKKNYEYESNIRRGLNISWSRLDEKYGQ